MKIRRLYGKLDPFKKKFDDLENGELTPFIKTSAQINEDYFLLSDGKFRIRLEDNDLLLDDLYGYVDTSKGIYIDKIMEYNKDIRNIIKDEIVNNIHNIDFGITDVSYIKLKDKVKDTINNKINLGVFTYRNHGEKFNRAFYNYGGDYEKYISITFNPFNNINKTIYLSVIPDGDGRINKIIHANDNYLNERLSGVDRCVFLNSLVKPLGWYPIR